MKETRLLGLKCGSCETVYPVNGEIQSICPACGPKLGTLECLLNYEDILRYLKKNPWSNRRDMSMFRYHELLPVINPDFHVPLQIGWTPVYDSPVAASYVKIRRVLVKDDGMNPTASYKDRASAMVVARARELDYEAVCTASTGNAAASLAACCRSVHMPCVVLVPASAPQAKLLQMKAYGATVIAVDGSYDDACDLAEVTCTEFGWMNRSAGLNPYLVEGKKTGAFELAEQTGWDLPDNVFVSVGDGSIITGLCKGFLELKKLQLVDRLPCVIGVQASGSNVLVRAWQRMQETGLVDFDRDPSVHTIADSICVQEPREGIRALRAVQATGGFFMEVSDDEITDAIKRLPLETGVFGEPAAAAAYAGLIRASATKMILSDESAAVFVTGSGLKDIATACRIWCKDEPPLKPDRHATRTILKRVKENEKR